MVPSRKDGPVPIEEIVVGQEVYSRDPQTGETRLKPVTALIETKPKALYELVMRSGDGTRESMLVTGDHPYWVKDLGWVRVDALTPGMTFTNLGGNDLHLEIVRLSDEVSMTYNFTVADFESYFAGENKVFVHNFACGPNEIIQLSKRKFGHTFEKHGQNSTKFLQFRASDMGRPNGQFLDDQ
ncbi:MAG TPA: polymorphic toxin-type HINT domain-containing protein, partial [Tahibacter sp.]|nr:polymorphic toxin-type HINT domain-containing protein [Tahibacter sp.]